MKKFGTRTRVAVAVLVAGAFLLLHVLYLPFKHAIDNRLEGTALLALTLTYFIGLLLKTTPGEGADHSQDAVFGAILIVLTCAVGVACAVVLYLSYRAHRHAVHERGHDSGAGMGGAAAPYVADDGDSDGGHGRDLGRSLLDSVGADRKSVDC